MSRRFSFAFLNNLLKDKDQSQVVVTTLTFIGCLYFGRKIFKGLSKYGLAKFVELLFIKLLKTVPGGNTIINSELEKEKQKMIEELSDDIKEGDLIYLELPEKGVSRELIRKELLNMFFMEKDTIGKGKAHGGNYEEINRYKVFDKYNELIPLVEKLHIKDEAYMIFGHSNSLFPFLFPGTRKFEVEIVSMVSKMLYAPEIAGNITCGGTESIFQAVKCYRKMGLKLKGIKFPNAVLPRSAHPAFYKACHYLNVEERIVPLKKDGSWQVDIKKMKSLIDSNTIMLVGSAPGFPHGVVDDIVAIGKLGKSNNIPVHVDNCLGGFVLSMINELNLVNIPFDFRVNGVTSISIDLHKQIGCPKGASCIIYSSNKIRKHQLYSYVDWPGGLYATTCFRGSINGGINAGAWASLLYKGKIGLQERAKRLYLAQQKVKEQLEQIDIIEIFGDPIAVCVTFTFSKSSGINPLSVGEALKEVGNWHLGMVQFPSGLHFQMGHRVVPLINDGTFIKDLKKAISLVKNNPKKYYVGMASIYGTSATIPDRQLVNESCDAYLELMSTPLSVLKNTQN